MYGPGKFEGEGFETFALHALSLDSAQDAEVGSVGTFGWHALFRGPVEVPGEVFHVLGTEAGYTLGERYEGARKLALMRGAILVEDSNGFVWSHCYSVGDLTNGRDALEADWAELEAMDAESEVESDA